LFLSEQFVIFLDILGFIDRAFRKVESVGYRQGQIISVYVEKNAIFAV
jgi:hypothetical protein